LDSSIIVIDNVMEKEYLDAMKAKVADLESYMKVEDHNPLYVKARLDLDEFYRDKRKGATIITVMADTLFNEAIYRRCDVINDYCFQIYRKVTFHKTWITAHIPGKPCGWHNDDIWNGWPNAIHMINYIFYLDMGGKFDKGDLLVSYDNIPKKDGIWKPVTEPTIHERVEYKDNRLVMIPAYNWHMVETIENIGKHEYRTPFDGRVSVNGHIGFRIVSS